jgi:tetratricopeptide (TPR) repeat protein
MICFQREGSMKLIKATCPACGGSLEVTDNLAFANCPHCGSKIILDWEGQTSLAVHLDLGKTFLHAGNYQEADKHFSLALEKNPKGGDAWFLKGIVRIASMRCADTNKRALFEEGKAYLQKSGYSKEEMLGSLVTLQQDKQLFETFLDMQLLIDRNNSLDKIISDLFLLAATGTQDGISARKQFLLVAEQQIAIVQSLLAQASGEERKKLYGKFRSDSQLARVYLEALLPDESNDMMIRGKKDWWEKKLISAKPSFWLEYLNRQEKQYEQKL